MVTPELQGESLVIDTKSGSGRFVVEGTRESTRQGISVCCRSLSFVVRLCRDYTPHSHYLENFAFQKPVGPDYLLSFFEDDFDAYFKWCKAEKHKFHK